jgi:hypothetical protein
MEQKQEQYKTVLRIRDPVFFDPWIRDPAWKKIWILDPQ